jgi:hypothetical protein
MAETRLKVITAGQYQRSAVKGQFWSLLLFCLFLLIAFPAVLPFLIKIPVLGPLLACLVGLLILCAIGALHDIWRRTSGIVNCSLAHQARLQAMVDDLPERVINLLMAKNYRIIAARSVTDLAESWKNEHPKGYRKGATYEQAGALTLPSRNIIVIAEEALLKTQLVNLDDQSLLAASLEHEVGHAMDFSLSEKSLSSSKEFIAAYDADVHDLSTADRGEFGYFLQPGEQGRQETFAEIFNSVSLPWRDAEAFERKFPRTTNEVRRRLLAAGIQLIDNKPICEK